MEYVKAILIKFISTAAVLWIVLNVFYGAGFISVILLSAAVTLLGFFLGDLFMLPRFENWITAVIDFVLVYALVWAYCAFFTAVNIPTHTAAGIAALVIALFELAFHKYVDSHILHEDNRTGGRTKYQLSPEERYQTEAGEQIDPIDQKDE